VSAILPARDGFHFLDPDVTPDSPPLFLTFCVPHHVSRTAGATAFKFGMQIDYVDHCPKMQNWGKGAVA